MEHSAEPAALVKLPAAQATQGEGPSSPLAKPGKQGEQEQLCDSRVTVTAPPNCPTLPSINLCTVMGKRADVKVLVTLVDVLSFKFIHNGCPDCTVAVPVMKIPVHKNGTARSANCVQLPSQCIDSMADCWHRARYSPGRHSCSQLRHEPCVSE